MLDKGSGHPKVLLQGPYLRKAVQRRLDANGRTRPKLAN